MVFGDVFRFLLRKVPNTVGRLELKPQGSTDVYFLNPTGRLQYSAVTGHGLVTALFNLFCQLVMGLPRALSKPYGYWRWFNRRVLRKSPHLWNHPGICSRVRPWIHRGTALGTTLDQPWDPPLAAFVTFVFPSYFGGSPSNTAGQQGHGHSSARTQLGFVQPKVASGA